MPGQADARVLALEGLQKCTPQRGGHRLARRAGADHLAEGVLDLRLAVEERSSLVGK